MARGIERREIFKDNKDRKSFVARLGDIVTETKTQCFAWVLIPNQTYSPSASYRFNTLKPGHEVFVDRACRLFQQETPKKRPPLSKSLQIDYLRGGSLPVGTHEIHSPESVESCPPASTERDNG
jgi:hypothetical protein